MIRRRVVSFLAFAASVGPAFAAPPPKEQAKIDQLIRFVEQQRNMKFLRNGMEHSSADAAKFLRGKMESMGENVATAHDFIERIASKSSTTGDPYQVSFADGRTIPVAQLLTDELKRIEHPR